MNLEDLMGLIRRKPVSGTTSGGAAQHGDKSKTGSNSMVWMATTLVMAIVFVLCTSFRPTSFELVVEERKEVATLIDSDEFKSKFQECNLPKPPPTNISSALSPVLVVGYPSSGGFAGKEGSPDARDMIAPIVRLLTGESTGAKNYHASGRKMKRCKALKSNVRPAVTCSSIHPIVSVRLDNMFQQSVILSIRNFDTVYPTYLSMKANMYHGEVGQISPESWRRNRDKHYQATFESWKNQITTWKNMESYQVGTLLPYEYMLDPERGPAVVEKIMNHLQTAGFPVVVSKEDLPCVWYNSVRAVVNFEKTYVKFHPGYTKQQKDWLVQAMATFADEVKDNANLHQIITFYRDQIQKSMYIDELLAQ